MTDNNNFNSLMNKKFIMKIQLIVFCTLLSLLAVKADDRCTGENTYYPSTTNCTQFYQCNADGIPTLIQCTDGLEFNPITLVSLYLSYFSKKILLFFLN